MRKREPKTVIAGGPKATDVRLSREWLRRLLPFVFGIWLLSIFGTSSTVVRPNEFFRLIQQAFQLDENALQGFQVFWGAAWLLIVKGWHFTEFAVLLLLCVGTLRRLTGSLSPTKILAAALFCIAFAASDEWHQTFIPDRFGTLWDVGVDSLGVSLATWWCLRRLPRRN
ncbi:MAG: VanZ family protein [Planctomycetales bacterium]|nr:VanZ family protein [Planctomycetales bacterium]